VDEYASGVFGAAESFGDVGVWKLLDKSKDQRPPLLVGKTIDRGGELGEALFVGEILIDAAVEIGLFDVGLLYRDGGDELAPPVVGARIACGVEEPGLQRRRPGLFGLEMPQSLGKHLSGEVFGVMVVADSALDITLDGLDIPRVNFVECGFAPSGCAPNRLFGWIVHVE